MMYFASKELDLNIFLVKRRNDNPSPGELVAVRLSLVYILFRMEWKLCWTDIIDRLMYLEAGLGWSIGLAAVVSGWFGGGIGLIY